MSVWVSSCVWALTLAVTPLDDAQRAFQEGRYEEAEALALEHAQPPQEGAAWNLIGLSRFRQKQPQKALEAFQKAAQAADAVDKGMWYFNTGACLFALERFVEAEEAFVAAARFERLRTVASLQAAWAAFEHGSKARARQHLEATGPSALQNELWALLDEERQQAQEVYDDGLAAFDGGDFEKARALFLKAFATDETFAEALIMSGASAWRLGLWEEARAEWLKAQGLPVSLAQAQVISDYLDRLSQGLRGQRPGFSFEGAVMGGVDTNVQQAGSAAREEFVPQNFDTTSPFWDVALWGGYRSRAWNGVLFDSTLSFAQRAYTQMDAEDFSLQASRLAVTAEKEAKGFRLGASLVGDVLFTGLLSYRGLFYGGSGSVYAALEPSVQWGSRLSVGGALRQSFSSEFSYLAGNRWNATVSTWWQRSRLRVSGWLLYRFENLGTLTQDTTVDLPLLCRGECTSAKYVLPFAWVGPSVGADLRYLWPTGQWLRLEADVEHRDYGGTTFLEIIDARGVSRNLGERQRIDNRYSGALTGAWPFGLWEFSLRYEVVWNTSNVDTRLDDAPGACRFPTFDCHAFDATNANYVKHVLAAAVSVGF